MTNLRTTRLFGKLWHGADYNYEQWLHRPDVLDEDFRLMRLANCNIMSVGIFSWVMLEPEEGQYQFDWLDTLMDRLARNGMFAALATPSAAPPAWMTQKYPEMRRMEEPGRRNPHRGRQNFCYTSPVYREKTTALNQRLAERYAAHPALMMWHVSNEYVSTPCHCDLCYATFRNWLKERYGDLDTLNHAWWATFWGHRYTDWTQIEPVDASNQGLMLDWKRFNSDRALDFFRHEIAPLREITPDVPVTTNFMRPDVGLDYWQFADLIDVITWDSYPPWHQGDDVITASETAFYHDLHRSYKKGQPFLLLESTPSVTNWQGVSRIKRPGVHKLTSLQAVAHGSNSVMYFQWRQSRGGDEQFHGAVINHLGHEHTQVFRDVQSVGDLMAQLDGVAATRIKADAAVIYDYENEWAINLARLPRTIGKDYQQTCIRHYRALWQQGVPADVINMEADFSRYQIVIAPMLYMLRPGVAERLEAFVTSGGRLVMTYLSGVIDESTLVLMGGFPAPLRRTLGLWREELDTLTDAQTGQIAISDSAILTGNKAYTFHHYAEILHLETASTLAAYKSEFYHGWPVLTANKTGDGKAYYLAARTDDNFLLGFYNALLDDAAVNRCTFDLPPGVSAQAREDDSARFVFIMNFADEPREVNIGEQSVDAATGDPIGPHLHLSAYELVILKQSK